MTDGLTVCPNCDIEYETIDQTASEKKSAQALYQQCPNCGEERVVGIINYPHDFLVLADALEDDVCTRTIYEEEAYGSMCEKEANYRLQRIGYPVEAVCDEHTEAHYDAAMELFE